MLKTNSPTSKLSFCNDQNCDTRVASWPCMLNVTEWLTLMWQLNVAADTTLHRGLFHHLLKSIPFYLLLEAFDPTEYLIFMWGNCLLYFRKQRSKKKAQKQIPLGFYMITLYMDLCKYFSLHKQQLHRTGKSPRLSQDCNDSGNTDFGDFKYFQSVILATRFPATSEDQDTV